MDELSDRFLKEAENDMLNKSAGNSASSTETERKDTHIKILIDK